MDDARRRKRFFDYVLDQSLPLAGTLAIVVAAIEAIVDWTTRVELDVSAIYGVPLVLAAVARNRLLLWALAAGLLVMTFAAYAAYGQLGNPERDSKKGWGLGLAICRRLAEVIGGTINVVSAPHQGTTFNVYLPAAAVIDAPRGGAASARLAERSAS